MRKFLVTTDESDIYEIEPTYCEGEDVLVENGILKIGDMRFDMNYVVGVYEQILIGDG